MEFAKLTSIQLEALSRDHTVFFFPVGPLEDHGPHLPLGMDLEEADRLCFLAAQHLEHEMPGWRGVIMPRAPLGIDAHTTRMVLTVRPHVLRDWLVDACQSLVKLGFIHFACFSGNLGPRQLTAIEEAGWLVNRGSGLRFPGSFRIGRRPTLISISSAFVKSGDWLKSPLWLDSPEHGGERDTSVALAIVPHQLDPDFQRLPKIERDSSFLGRLAARLGKQPSSYWGNPADATAEAGGRYLLEAIDEVFPKMRAVWEGANPRFLFKSWYSLMPVNKSFFKVWVLVILLCILAAAWFSMSFLKFEI